MNNNSVIYFIQLSIQGSNKALEYSVKSHNLKHTLNREAATLTNLFAIKTPGFIERSAPQFIRRIERNICSAI